MAKKTEEGVQTSLLSDQLEYVNCLYYGEAGTGKTTHLASLARAGRIVHVDVESGIKRSALVRRDIPIEQIELIQSSDFEMLEKLFWQIKEELTDGGGPVGVSWDSLTELQQRMQTAAAGEAAFKANQRGMERSRFVKTQEDYRLTNDQIRELVREFRDLQCHWGVACLERREVDDDGAVVYGPAVSPVVQQALMGYMDIVCHTTVEIVADEPMFFGAFSPAGKYLGKDRFGALPRRLVDPTFDRVIAYVNGDLTAETDEVMIAARERYVTAQTKTEGEEGA